MLTCFLNLPVLGVTERAILRQPALSLHTFVEIVEVVNHELFHIEICSLVDKKCKYAAITVGKVSEIIANLSNTS